MDASGPFEMSTAAEAAASSLGASLGLSDPSLDEGKMEGQAIAALQLGTKKRPKVTHSLLFEDDRGLKKMLRTFPQIKFQGKGREYEDVTLLLRHYKKFFAELHPYGEHFEDLVLKTRQVLEDKEKDDDGTISDPRERLHAFRFQYKNTPTEDMSAPKGGAQLSDEARARIDANRKLALERKAAKNATAGGAPAAPAAVEEEIDMDEMFRNAEADSKAMPQNTSQGPPHGGFDDEDDDPFGFGGGFDDDAPPPSARPASQSQAAPSAFDEDEDVFGFGGGFDDADSSFGRSTRTFAALAAPAPKAAPVPVPAAPAAKPVDPEVARRIAENRAKALERKAAAAAAEEKADAAAMATLRQQKLSATAPEEEAAGSAPMVDDEEEDGGFDFGCSGFDDP